MFGQWRGGRRLVRNLELELYQDFERQVLDDETRIIQGLGEGGDAVELDVNHLAEASLKEYGVNVYLSDHIAYNRTLRDYRNPACAQVVYDTELPSASVIIIFHNEPYSTLIRTVWSVINNDRNNTWFSAASRGIAQNYTSMSAYLKEIILVDDKSTLSELKGKLDYYMRTRLPPDLIRIVRLTQRVGLIRARVAGARVAVGDVLVFLDAHCEGQPDWLRPMLQRIKDSPRSVIAPISDFIVSTTLRYAVKEPVTSFEVGGFLFLAPFVWIQLSDREIERRASDIAPTRLVFYKRTATALLVCKLGTYRTRLYRLIYVKYILNVKRSPTMAGGLFAMYRSYFWQLGAYDEQMVHWGGENLEMSFRIWQCINTLEYNNTPLHI